MLKAIREAKQRTSWANPNADYEAAVAGFVKAILSPTRAEPFLESFVPFQRYVARLGGFNSLSQVLIKLTAPGVPDIYQGNELWDLSLVDPDNRRPVDYDLRRKLLAELAQGLTPEAILRRSGEGLPKLWVTRQALHFRRRRPELFGP